MQLTLLQYWLGGFNKALTSTYVVFTMKSFSGLKAFDLKSLVPPGKLGSSSGKYPSSATDTKLCHSVPQNIGDYKVFTIKSRHIQIILYLEITDEFITKYHTYSEELNSKLMSTY